MMLPMILSARATTAGTIRQRRWPWRNLLVAGPLLLGGALLGGALLAAPGRLLAVSAERPEHRLSAPSAPSAAESLAAESPSAESPATERSAESRQALIGAPRDGGRDEIPPAPHDWIGLGARGAVALLALPLALWVLRRPRVVNRVTGPGFEVVSPTERRRFVALEGRLQALDFINRIETIGQLRLSANLNKVTLSVRRYGYLMEDKNYRNALLVNRRRVRRTLLRDGDVLDLGDLTLLYRDNRAANIVRFSSITPADGKPQLKFDRLQGPIRRGMPMLVPEPTPGRPFYVSKNKVFIGRSENNDLVIKSRNVYYRHAKLERVGGRWKLQDLSILGNTFVNNRRIEQRFLKEGDEISIESHRFRFALVTRAMRERPPQSELAGTDDPDELAPDALAAAEGLEGLESTEVGDGAEDTDYAQSP